MDEPIENIIPAESEDTFLQEETGGGSRIMIIIPLLISIFFFAGFIQDKPIKKNSENIAELKENTEKKNRTPNISFSALLAPEEFSKNIRDTVYTKEDIWLELRIDKQMLYAHHRDGRVIAYPVSSGNPGLSKGIESRAGLYAIFIKEEVHLSSQFNNARMNYYMPFNMGIGFHGLPGTGYYGFLGVRPSSHGCIRMRNDDVGTFGQCKIGTLVLAHKGKSARIVAFAPEDLKNDGEFTKDDYLNILAYNLSSVMEGKYFINPPKKFVMDGNVIPRSGINVTSTDNIPDKQILPFAVLNLDSGPDRLAGKNISAGSVKELSETGFAEGFEFTGSDSTEISGSKLELAVNPEMVKKYVYNPIGILPYFPPNR
jgi:hypothetical protein